MSSSSTKKINKQQQQQQQQQQLQEEAENQASNDGLYTLMWLLTGIFVSFWILKQTYGIRVQQIESMDMYAMISTKSMDDDVGFVLHGEDAYFHYRATEYLNEHGIAAFYTSYDTMTWYPFGRPPIGKVLSSNPVGLPVLAVFLKQYFLCGTDMSIYDICCYIPVWYGVLTTLLIGMMTYECCRKLCCDSAKKKIDATNKDNKKDSSSNSSSSCDSTANKDIKNVHCNNDSTSSSSCDSTVDKDCDNNNNNKYFQVSSYSSSSSTMSVVVLKVFGFNVTLHSPAFECAILSMFMMALMPAHLKPTIVGRYNNDCFAVFCMNVTFYFWIKTFQSILEMNNGGGGGHTHENNEGGRSNSSVVNRNFGCYTNILFFFVSYVCLITTKTKVASMEGWDTVLNKDNHNHYHDDEYCYHDNIYSLFVFHLVVLHAGIILLSEFCSLVWTLCFKRQESSDRLMHVRSMKSFAILIIVVLLITIRTLVLLSTLPNKEDHTMDDNYLRPIILPLFSSSQHQLDPDDGFLSIDKAAYFLSTDKAIRRVLVNLQLSALFLPFSLVMIIYQLIATRKSDFLKTSFLLLWISYAVFLNSRKIRIEGNDYEDCLIVLMAPIGSVLAGMFSGQSFVWSVHQWWNADDQQQLQQQQQLTKREVADNSASTISPNAEDDAVTATPTTANAKATVTEQEGESNTAGSTSQKQSGTSSRRNDMKRTSSTKKAAGGKVKNNRKKKKTSSKTNTTTNDATSKTFTVKRIAALLVFLLGYFFQYMFTWMCWYISKTIITDAITGQRDSIITVENHIHNGTKYINDDYREAYTWLRENTPTDSRILAWSDYGYHINAISNRTTIADDNFGTKQSASTNECYQHIALLGMAFTSSLDDGYEIVQHLADYVLIYNGKSNGDFTVTNAFDDLDKSIEMMRIADSVYGLHVCPNSNDISCPSFFGYIDNFDNHPSPAMAKSLIYNLHSHGLVENVYANPNKFQDVYKTRHGRVRIFKVVNPSKESKAWFDDPAQCSTYDHANKHKAKVTRSLPPTDFDRHNLPMPVPMGDAPIEDVMHSNTEKKLILPTPTDDGKDNGKVASSGTTKGSNKYCPRQYPPGLTNKIHEIKENRKRLRAQFASTYSNIDGDHGSESRESIITFKRKQNTKEDVYNTWEDSRFTQMMWRLIATNQVSELRQMIKRDPLLPFVRSSDGRGPMWWAFEQRTEEIKFILMDAGVPHTDVDAQGLAPEDLI